MLPTPSLEGQDALADTLQRPHTNMTFRERLAEGVVTAGFLGAVAALWIARPPGAISPVPAIVCMAILVMACRIRIDTPFGYTTPVQLAFVPLLFAVPVVLVPFAVVLAVVLQMLPDVVAGKMRPSRLMQSIPNASYCLGPVAVFVIVGVAPQHASPWVLVVAFAAQFAVDFTAARLRDLFAFGKTLAELVQQSWVVVVDAALSGVGLLVAERVHDHPIAALAPLPLLGLVAMFARERRQRLESLIELNTAYRRARDEAIEASEMKSAFLRNVSHEIRTPMNGVIGMNELLLQTPLSDEQRGYAEQVEQSSEHMLAIINDILDISQIETGRVELEPSEFALQEAVEGACVSAGLEAQAKGLELEMSVDSRLPRWVRGDSARVRQVLSNLVGNAVKFSSSGVVEVRVRPGEETSRVIFEVRDHGIGIDPAALERMFEPFMQADVSTTRKYGGNGLGLAIAKEIVDLMGGAIGADSKPGKGSTFWFELPLPGVVSNVPQAGRERASAIGERRYDPNAPLVLVVEDSPVNRLVTVHVLERCGFRVHVVNDGREALEALGTQPYEAVLMDCQMPEVDGYEATRELRRREEKGDHRTPVIAMTAHAMSGDRERCLAAGMDDYIAKPVRSQALVTVLRKWIPEARPNGAADDRVAETAEAVAESLDGAAALPQAARSQPGA
ncbi:MAG TPA: ATP-binding protein [Solirubrobacteraceae bacterium]|jgi:signal transduction histidine kinase/DNA-binding NarL/FixJ family response regulator|nr:ATP-binding protein [Solirubrobacteraceae bacterium]